MQGKSFDHTIQLGIKMEIHKGICPECNVGLLNFVKADLPWSAKHFICPVCDSTYEVEKEIVFEMEDKNVIS